MTSRVTVGAQVECTDGACGELTALLIDPAKRAITHYVVRVEKDGVERMVPAERVASSTPSGLTLNCTQAEVDAAETFVKDELAAAYLPDPHEGSYAYYYSGYGYGYGIPDVVPPDPQYVTVHSDRVPLGELGLREGTPVRATDGQIGIVASLVLNDAGTITHFVVEEGGRFGGHADLTLPLVVIEHVDDEGVHLKLDKKALSSVPTLPSGADSFERVQLVARVFDTTDGAQQALDLLREAATTPGPEIKIREAAVLVRDADGTPRITQTHQSNTGKGALVGGAAGGLLTLLGPIGFVAGAAVGAGVGAIVGSRADSGLPDAFLERLEKRVEPGHSALVVLVEHGYAQDLMDVLAEPDKAIAGQTMVDTLVQELLLEADPASKAEQ
jgi:uncharacterized membrane protein